GAGGPKRRRSGAAYTYSRIGADAGRVDPQLKADTDGGAIDRAVNGLQVNTRSAVGGQRHTNARHHLVGLQRILEWSAKEIVQRNRPLASIAACKDRP